MNKPRVVRGAGPMFCLVALIAAVLAGGASAATTPIYKCFDKNLGLLYTDEPCKEGERLNIRAGEADPAAVARLERQRDALDQSAAQRIADLRRPSVEGQSASQLPYEPPDQHASYDYGSGYVSDYGTLAQRVRHRRAQEPRPEQHTRHFAPPPPYFVPRR